MIEGEDYDNFLQVAEMQESWQGKWSKSALEIRLFHQVDVCEGQSLNVSDISLDGPVSEPSGALPVLGEKMEIQDVLFKVEDTAIEALRVLKCVVFVA